MSSTELVISPLNYIGGKGKILPQILPLFPNNIDIFLDLFCGGCNVGINVNAQSVIYNDSLEDLIGIYRMFTSLRTDSIVNRINQLIDHYGLSKTSEYNYVHYKGSSNKGVAEYNKRQFLQLRSDFNALTRKNNQYYIMLYTLVIFSFNNQIRFNADGKYNLPVGKRDFNNSMKKKLIGFVNKLKQQNCTFTSRDFRKINTDILTANSFVYADPPYLISDATYNENGGWTETDERDLLAFLDLLNQNGIHFALSNVLRHKGRTNDILLEWSQKYNVHHLTNDYSNSNYQVIVDNSESDEVLITNY